MCAVTSTVPPTAAPPPDRDIVLPSHDDDPIAAGAAGAFGGPVGRHARIGGHRFWTPVRWLLVLATLTIGLAWAQKAACRDPFGWQDEYQYTRMCYSDITALYYAEGLNEGKTPYIDHPVEYPVVVGGVMWFSAKVAQSLPWVDGPSAGPPPSNAEAEAFFDITALILAAGLLLVVVLTAKLARRRPWDAALVALAPAMVIHAYTNWDLVAAALAALAIHAWSRERTVWAGVWIAAGASAKLYPVLLLVPLLALCIRAGRTRAWAVTTASAAAAFAAINLPVYLAATSFSFDKNGVPFASPNGENAWLRFWSLNKHRPADWDSLWFIAQRNLDNGSSTAVNLVKGFTVLFMMAAAAAIVWATITILSRLPGRVRRWTLVLPAAAAAAVGVGLLLQLLVLAGVGGPVPGLRDRMLDARDRLLDSGVIGGFWDQMSAIVDHRARTPFQFMREAPDLPPTGLNAGVFWGTVVVMLLVTALAIAAPRRPRLAQLAFLAVAGFLLVNKVNSPQYVIWLIPLAALARPRWRAFLIWQVTELLVLVTRFYFFVGNNNPGQGIGFSWFGAAVVVRDIALVVVMALVVREIYRPELDVVRRDGEDDPSGGVLDGAADSPALVRA